MQRTTRWPLQGARWIATGLVVVTYALLVFGSTVRINEAGLACPDWPMCFGQVVPAAMNLEIFLEWGHRALAGLISLAFLGLGGVIFASRELRRRFAALWVFCGVILAVQIVLGGLTVLKLLAEWTVTSHLVTGNAFCLLLLVMALSLWDVGRQRAHRGTSWPERIAVVVLGVAIFVQLGLGGFVASSHAGLACGQEWPNCGNGGWFPTFVGTVGLQVGHRLGAYVVLAAAAAVVGFGRGRGRAGLAGLAVCALVLFQAGLGITNVWYGMPGLVTAMHSAGAALCVLATAWLVYETWRAPLKSTASVPNQRRSSAPTLEAS